MRKNEKQKPPSHSGLGNRAKGASADPLGERSRYMNLAKTVDCANKGIHTLNAETLNIPRITLNREAFAAASKREQRIVAAVSMVDSRTVLKVIRGGKVQVGVLARLSDAARQSGFEHLITRLP